MSNTFVVKINDKEVTLEVRQPTLKDQQESQKIYNRAFAEAVDSNALLRAKLDRFVRDQGIWDDSKEEELKTLQKSVAASELKLAKGGFKLSEARQVALDMKKIRGQMRELLTDRMSYDNNTAEGQADNARFNYLVSVCTLYKDTKQPFFKNYEDFLTRDTDEATVLASQKLAHITYGLEEDYEDTLPENEFLKEFKFVNDKLRLIDKNGRLITQDGQLINEEGHYINEEGSLVDINGNLLDEKGNLKVERQPFLDDDDQPISGMVNNEENQNGDNNDGDSDIVRGIDNDNGDSNSQVELAETAT